MYKFFGISLFTLICVFAVHLCAQGLPTKFIPENLLSRINASGEFIETKPDEYVDPLTGMIFVRIKGGCFQMGSPGSERGHKMDETPRSRVCLDDYWMGKYEITNAQYRFFVEGHDSRTFAGFDLNTDDQPVVFVDWLDATNYAAWLSQKSGKKYRLPTEAQWEYAARGKNTAVQYRKNKHGEICDYVNAADQTAKHSAIGLRFNLCTDGFPVSAPVGSFKPNRYGLFDMLGNVWEWTSDWYSDRYRHVDGENNPQGSTSGKFRVLRGGSWFSGPEFIRVARRSWYRPDSQNNSLGFRLIMLTDDWTQ